MFGDLINPSGKGTLARFTRDLTADARAGRLEPVRCRGDEISRVVDILLRHSKNNPALVGQAGVGKTAIAEGLAQRIAAGMVPVVLRSARVLALDHVSLLGGTMYRGQYEERISALVAEASSNPDAILFIDELHNLIGQGTAMGAAMDAANMLKPALVRGEFRVIGATTEDEYDRWVCGDPALERRFQKVPVRELSAEQTLEILRARVERLERHHNVVIADEALLAAVKLTDLFVTDRARPDRAIDALDEACAHTQAGATYSSAIEPLIVERRRLLLEIRRDDLVDRRSAVDGTANVDPTTSGVDGSGGEEGVGGDEDPLDRWARDSFAAIERFGAEIEAALARQPVTATKPPAPAPRDHTDVRTPEQARRGQTRAERLAILDAELRHKLAEDGMVVRGHDVARVVSVATGQSIQWTE
ncbi:MAG: AAA family ATPase [Gemmatimonadaceae bacterium]